MKRRRKRKARRMKEERRRRRRNEEERMKGREGCAFVVMAKKGTNQENNHKK